MPAVDILMPDGQWVRGRDIPQDVANHIGMGADVYEPGTGKKLVLVFYNALGKDPVNNFDPDVWNIQVPGGTGPNSSIPLRQYLSQGAQLPTTTQALTNVGGPTPGSGSGGSGGGGGNIDLNVDGTVTGGATWGGGSGPSEAGIAGAASGGAVALGLGLLFLLFGRKKPRT